MRLAVIADIHGNVLALDAVLADIARRSVDLTVNLGDCASGPLWPRETMELLASLNLPTVRGNHDRWMAETPRERMSLSDGYAHDALLPAQRAWLGSLPMQYGPHEGIVGVHATPNDDNRYLLEDVIEGQLVFSDSGTIAARVAGVDCAVLLCGHSHLPRVVQVPGGPLVVNPGSVGCPAYSDPIPPAHVSESGSPHARYALLSRSSGQWRVELIALEYDWTAASKRASENRRPEWARGVATGFIR
jgi:predicted phosphodiesterase